jgi:hypothetical protein
LESGGWDCGVVGLVLGGIGRMMDCIWGGSGLFAPYSYSIRFVALSCPALGFLVSVLTRLWLPSHNEESCDQGQEKGIEPRRRSPYNS